MEVVNVAPWGKKLIAPDAPRYALMHDVRVGDVVLHWVAKNNPMRSKPGMYGASLVADKLRNRADKWLGKPANVIPLTGYTPLSQPYLLSELRTKHQEDILIVRTMLELKFAAADLKIYFPFHRHPSSGLKPNQGYLFKLPAEVITKVGRLLPENWEHPSRSVNISDVERNGMEERQRYAGICADPALKKAIEEHAVRQATAHYEAAGFTVTDVGAYRSFDLLATRRGEERQIEVKGSQGRVDKVILTRNEVAHAYESEHTDLVVVAEVLWKRNSDGAICTADGLMSIHSDWHPTPGRLSPLTYEYLLD